MGTCMSKTDQNNMNNHKSNKTADITSSSTSDQPNVPQQHRFNRERRRLSVSQADRIPAIHNDEQDHRGQVKVNISSSSVLNFFSGKRRFSFAGALSQERQSPFDNKTNVLEGDAATATDLGIAYACRKGLKPESPNQDDFFIIRAENWGLYGVFDGHGPCGHTISNYVQQHLPKLILLHPQFKTDPATALVQSFEKVHAMIETESVKPVNEGKKFDAIMSGTTATVVLHLCDQNRLYVAHVGDSRAVLCKKKKRSGHIECIELTEDHKPDLPREKQRIEKSGGVVRRMPHDVPHRVFMKDRSLPGLAMSRAIGDSLAQSIGVTATPDVGYIDLDPGEDVFVLICSDGVWEFISSQEAVETVELVKNGSRNPITEKLFDSAKEGLDAAVDYLASQAWNHWIAEEGSVVDDITCVVFHCFPKVDMDEDDKKSDLVKQRYLEGGTVNIDLIPTSMSDVGSDKM